MSSKQSTEKILDPIRFLITPIQIIKNQPTRNKIDKSFLIKINNQSKKCDGLGQTIQFNLNAAYSQTLMKFYPIKGIIKINDKMEDGSEVTLGVGGFRIDQILNRGQKQAIISQEVGPVTLKMNVKVSQIPFYNSPQKPQKSKSNTIQITKTPKYISTPKNLSQKSLIDDLMENQFTKTPTYSCKVSKNEKQKSNFRQLGSDSVKRQTQLLNENLVREKRKNQALEENLLKANLKNSLLGQKISEIEKNIESLNQSFNKFKGNMKLDASGSFVCEVNEVLKQLRISYKTNTIKQSFIQFIKVVQKIKQVTIDYDKQSQQSLSVLKKFQQLQEQKLMLFKENEQKDYQIKKLKMFLGEKSSLTNVQRRLSNQRDQILKLQDLNEKLSIKNNELQQTNLFYKQKINIYQNQITQKESALQTYIKKQKQYRQQINFMQKQLKKQFNQNQNNKNLIDEKNQEISNITQLLQKYRNKYGQIGTRKNKALQNQIKECLRWIESQHNSELNQSRDTIYSEIENTQSNSNNAISEVIKNIEIQTLPLEEIGGIRNQLLKILKRVDQLLEGSQTSKFY